MDIVFIMANKELARNVIKITSELYSDIKIDVYIGMFKRAVKIAESAEIRGAKTIVCRWKTAQMIREYVSIPVIDIPLNSHDITDSLVRASEHSNNIALIGWPEILKGIEKVAQFLSITIKTFNANNIRDLENAVKKAKNQGFSSVIGGQEVVRLSNKYGIKGYLLKPGDTAICNALNQAIKLIKKEGAQPLLSDSQILDEMEDGVLLLNNKGIVKYLNKKSLTLLGCSDNIINKHFSKMEQEWLNNIIEENNSHNIYTYNCKNLLVRKKTIDDLNEILLIITDLNDASFKHFKSNHLKNKNEVINPNFKAKYSFSNLIGNCHTFVDAINIAKTFAKTDANIILSGETGTGKELFAHSIHNFSSRNKFPFIPINLATLPLNLIDSELFGYVEGAFTGAKKGLKPGYLEMANNGTIFLDEISEMSLDVQVKLLRFLEEKIIYRIGDNRPTFADVRIIVATNKDLYNLIKQEKFRKDLFYRLNILNLKIPSLRERKDDISVLCDYFLNHYASKYNKGVKNINLPGMARLFSYSWPGNVRELKNIIERLVILSVSSEISEWDILEIIGDNIFENYEDKPDSPGILKLQEDQLILKTLIECNWRKKMAAEKLGISTTTLWRKLKMIKQ